MGDGLGLLRKNFVFFVLSYYALWLRFYTQAQVRTIWIALRGGCTERFTLKLIFEFELVIVLEHRLKEIDIIYYIVKE